MMILPPFVAFSAACTPGTRRIPTRGETLCNLPCAKGQKSFLLPTFPLHFSRFSCRHPGLISLAAKVDESSNSKKKKVAEFQNGVEDKSIFPKDEAPVKLESFEGHSYVEGEIYKDRAAEIEAMGGDPFFLSLLDDEDVEENESDSLKNTERMKASLSLGILHQVGLDASKEKSKDEWKVTDGKGPKPVEEEEIDIDDWDGNAIEDAHFD